MRPRQGALCEFHIVVVGVRIVVLPITVCQAHVLYEAIDLRAEGMCANHDKVNSVIATLNRDRAAVALDPPDVGVGRIGWNLIRRLQRIVIEHHVGRPWAATIPVASISANVDAVGISSGSRLGGPRGPLTESNNQVERLRGTEPVRGSSSAAKGTSAIRHPVYGVLCSGEICLFLLVLFRLG